MTDTSRGESWLKNKGATRQDAEITLVDHGENPESIFWRQVLDNLFPEEKPETPTGEKEEPIIGEIIPEEESEENLTLQQRAGRFIRRILRGITSE